MKRIIPFLIIFIFTQIHSFAQSIAGRVIDNDIKEGVVGANITIEGAAWQTNTDLKGNYTLKLLQGRYTLVVKAAGYQVQRVPIRILTNEEVKIDDISLLEALVSTDDIAVAVGSRAASTRSKNETTSPIDVISAKDLQAYGNLDLSEALHFLVPSFNSNRQSGSDISDHINPSTVRGLGPDQILVLVNGKRYHQSALINVFGTRGRGNTVTDFNSIPVNAVDHIEILRDGAAAQYGSDAIAGVINIVLKSNPSEFSGGVNTGIYKAGDGFMVNPYANYGFKVGEGGFVNVSGELLSKDQTIRPSDATYTALPRKNFGDAKYMNSSIYLNVELPFNQRTKFYTFGGFNIRNTNAAGFTYEADNDRNVKALFPNGFDPVIKTNIQDISFSVGIKKHTESGWDIDFNNTFGRNGIDISIDRTVNSSLGAKSPTSFVSGGYALSQNTTGLYFSRKFNILSGLNLAFGSEFRLDNYEIKAGDEASWQKYNVAPDQPGGSQNYPGIRPSEEIVKNGNAVKASRNNLGIYGDVELDVNKDWLIAGAVRFENYSDFGGTLNMKLATRYKVNPKFAIRSSLSTGFRAPSLAQVYFSSTINDVIGAGVFIEKVIATNNSPITKALGIPSLTQETSVNGSLGFAYQPSPQFSFSVDAYSVSVKNRIVLTGAFYNDDPQLAKTFNDLGVVAAQFFANTLNTQNYGIDLVGSWTNDYESDGVLVSSLAFNLNGMDLGTVKTTGLLVGKEDSFVGNRDKSVVLASAPRAKGSLMFDYKLNKFSANVRFTYFAGLTLVNYNDEDNVYAPKMTTDFTLGYSLTKTLKASVGVSNLFNVFPTKQNPEFTETGGMYEAIQMGFGGTFAFARLKVAF